MTEPSVKVVDLSKSFTLHVQGGVRLIAFQGLNLEVFPGQCLALNGPSGSGKSSLLRSLYANYAPQAGQIWVRHQGRPVDMVSAPPRLVLEVRRKTLGFVSQFLRVIPRVSTLDIVSEPLRRRGVPPDQARTGAEEMLRRLSTSRTACGVFRRPPFPAGEQQRVNVARGFISEYPVLLLDEPTASLDARNRDTVLELIHLAKNRGAAVVGIFHDPEVRTAVADRTYEMRP